MGNKNGNENDYGTDNGNDKTDITGKKWKNWYDKEMKMKYDNEWKVIIEMEMIIEMINGSLSFLADCHRGDKVGVVRQCVAVQLGKTG